MSRSPRVTNNRSVPTPCIWRSARASSEPRLTAEHDLEEARSHFQQARNRDWGERTQLQDGFRTTLAARDLEIEQLQGNLKATMQELDITRGRREVLQTEADRVPQLQKQLNESRAEILLQFEHSPLALCQCTRSGTLMRANRAFALLVDYRKTDELRSADFAKSVFESPDDLFVLIRALPEHTGDRVD